MRLSIVTTLYYSSRYLEEFHSRASAAARKLAADDYEIILVDDGSPDDSLDVARRLFEGDSHVRVVELSRNFGHHKAIMTGLEHARGELVFLLDCDLEEAPELLARFDEERERTGVDVVFGVRSRRDGTVLSRLAGDLFYSIFNWLSPDPIPRNLVTARLMRREYVQALLGHREREVFLAGLFAIAGFKQAPLTIEKPYKGSSTYSLGRRLSMMVQSVTSFSNKPLIFVFYLGALIVSLTFASAGALLVAKLFFGIYLPGWTSLILSIWLLGGLTIFSIGIVGIYLSKVYIEVKNRPYTIVRNVYEHEESSTDVDRHKSYVL